MQYIWQNLVAKHALEATLALPELEGRSDPSSDQKLPSSLGVRWPVRESDKANNGGTDQKACTRHQGTEGLQCYHQQNKQKHS